MARKRDYAAEYARRKARDIEAGTTPAVRRKAREQAAGKQRDYALEQERREIRSRGRGFTGLAEQRKYRAAGLPEEPKAIEAWRRTNVLAKFGLTKREFDRIRTENRNFVNWYGRQHYNDINTYNMGFDQEIHNWTEERVGYIVSFHGAIVNPATNYDSLVTKKKGKDGKWSNTRKLTRNGKPLTNAEQFFYLVKYTGLMTVNEFEQRYGNRAISEARGMGVPNP